MTAQPAILVRISSCMNNFTQSDVHLKAIANFAQILRADRAYDVSLANAHTIQVHSVIQN